MCSRSRWCSKKFIPNGPWWQSVLYGGYQGRNLAVASMPSACQRGLTKRLAPMPITSLQVRPRSLRGCDIFTADVLRCLRGSPRVRGRVQLADQPEQAAALLVIEDTPPWQVGQEVHL